MSRLEERAEALRSLAALLRAGLGAHGALREWHNDAPLVFRSELSRLARRLTLGRRPPECLAELHAVLGGDAHAVAAIFALHTDLGGDAARVLDRLAGAIDRRAAAVRAARAAAAGALLSGRIVAGLPLLLLLLAPLSKAPLLDALGIAMMVAGAALAAAGMWWIGRLVPRPPSAEDPAALISDSVAAALRAGASLEAALESASLGPSADPASLRRARRAVILGASWPDALRSGDRILAGMAVAVGRAYRLGTPVAEALELHADRCREVAIQRFEAALRRAPVLMVLPLSFCVLPAYAVLGLGPHLRTLASGL